MALTTRVSVWDEADAPDPTLPGVATAIHVRHALATRVSVWDEADAPDHTLTGVATAIHVRHALTTRVSVWSHEGRSPPPRLLMLVLVKRCIRGNKAVYLQSL